MIQNHFTILRWGILALIVAALLSATALYFSYQHLTIFENNALQAQQHLNLARTQLSTAQIDQENIGAYARDYSLILERGIIGEEQRLNWIESLEQFRNLGIVQDLKYTISPQQPYALALDLESKYFKISHSPINLQIALLHEGQLFTLLNALRTQTNGYFMLDHCSVARIGYDTTNAATLRTECVGGWVTLLHEEQP